MTDRLQLVRDMYGAYQSGDRRVVEETLSDEDFVFYSPPRLLRLEPVIS
ncbi:MAG TPA: hypothetical protein VFF79_13305 [Conexibacter sp.]|jgi:hypothetical protein|nr:hypothetical protein [Conexibacter sp.]